ncbi:MAG: ComEC/Rec2 family competence protein [Patescibacteria group bacterium]|nr:ComEC/Rec2 family competence protein [Patescibacteria group bacterium]
MHSTLAYQFRRTSLLVTGCVGSLLGLSLARRGISATATAVGIGVVLCILPARSRTLAAVVSVLLATTVVGLWRGTVVRAAQAQYQPLYGHQITVRVSVLNDATYSKTKQLSFDAHNVQLLSGQPLPGKLAISGFGLNSIYYGDELVVRGKLQTTLGTAQGRISFAQLQLVRHHPSFIGETRRSFAVGLQNALPEPLDGFALGLLVGQRATLPQAIKDSLLMVGLTHIIAVSGYNLTIILRASKRLLARHSKRLSTCLSLGLIVCFILITGFSASIVRAAIVSSLSLYASYYGRYFKPLLLLLLVAAMTALVNPVYIWSDAGWYLSFLAFGGVMIISPLLAERLPARLQASTVAMIAVESIAAEMTTIPYLLHTFGQMSFVGLIGNTVIAVFIPLAMLLSATAGLVGMLAASFAGWIAWPAVLLLTYMLDTAQLLSHGPHVFQKNLSLSGGSAIAMYVAVAFVWLILYFKKPPKPAILTDKNASIIPLQERMHLV